MHLFLSKNSDSITIRPVCLDSDTVFLQALYAESRQDLQYLAANDEVIRQIISAQYHAQLSGYRAQFPQADYFLIECQSIPCGRLIIDQSNNTLRVVEFVLLTSKQNQGIGSTLFKRLQHFVTIKKHKIQLQMDPHNPALQHFYQQLGFQIEASNAVNQALFWLPDSVE
jgi:RimJ/RimL family protein N-acetyltransferase